MPCPFTVFKGLPGAPRGRGVKRERIVVPRLDPMTDSEALGGQGVLASVVRKQGALEGYAVGGCCDLSTSVHHLIDKLGEELGYIMAADTGWDVEDCIPCMATGLKLRAAARIWRGYYKHAFARQKYHYADPPLHGGTDSTPAGEEGRRGGAGHTRENQAAKLFCSKIKKPCTARP